MWILCSPLTWLVVSHLMSLPGEHYSQCSASLVFGLISGLIGTPHRSASSGLLRSFYSTVWMSHYLQELSEITSLS